VDNVWLESDTEWVVTLWSGEVLSIFADGYSAEGENLVFDVCVPGKPSYVVEIARVPYALIDNLVSEIAGRPDAPINSLPDPPGPISDAVAAAASGLYMTRWEAEKALESDTEWAVTLVRGEALSIYADSTSVEGEDRVFTVSVGENPPNLVEIARVPLALISDYTSELADRPGAPDRYPPLPRMPFAEGLPVPTRPNAPSN
jgi:hypothetical protein